MFLCKSVQCLCLMLPLMLGASSGYCQVVHIINTGLPGCVDPFEIPGSEQCPVQDNVTCPTGPCNNPFPFIWICVDEEENPVITDYTQEASGAGTTVATFTAAEPMALGFETTELTNIICSSWHLCECVNEGETKVCMQDEDEHLNVLIDAEIDTEMLCLGEMGL